MRRPGPRTPPNATEWYYPRRLRLDIDAASPLRQTAAARHLGLRLMHGEDIDVPLYAYSTDLTEGAVARGARRLVRIARACRAAGWSTTARPPTSTRSPPGRDEPLPGDRRAVPEARSRAELASLRGSAYDRLIGSGSRLALAAAAASAVACAVAPAAIGEQHALCPHQPHRGSRDRLAAAGKVNDMTSWWPERRSRSPIRAIRSTKLRPNAAATARTASSARFPRRSPSRTSPRETSTTRSAPREPRTTPLG